MLSATACTEPWKSKHKLGAKKYIEKRLPASKLFSRWVWREGSGILTKKPLLASHFKKTSNPFFVRLMRIFFFFVLGIFASHNYGKKTMK